MKATLAPSKCHLRWALLLLAALLLTHCRTVGFYAQAARGQWQILQRAQPIDHLLTQPSTPPALRDQLEIVQDLRHFAATELGLPTRRQYDRYSDLQREHVVWVLFVCPELSVAPHRWTYPFLGKLAYTGYFSPVAAQQEAERFRKNGQDVHIAGVDAYSTLGFFSDPVLNTFVDHPPAQLAELIFHELTHQRIYLKGDTDFNEALATAVGQAATERWLESRGQTRQLTQYRRHQTILREFVELLLQTRDRLESLFADPTLSNDQKRQRKLAEWTRLRQQADALNHRHGGSLKIDQWFAQPPNNARLASVSSYHLWVPAFRQLLKENDGDLDRFFNAVMTQKKRSPAERIAWLESLHSVTTP